MKKKIIIGILFGIGVFTAIAFLTIYHNKPLAKQKLTVGIFLSPPYSFKTHTGTGYSGFDIELLDALAEKLGMQITYREIKFDNAFDLLNKKQIDCVPGITINSSRENIIDFSWPYNEVGLQLMKRANDSTINSLKDLKGKKVATISDTGSQGTYCRAFAAKEGIAGIQYFKSYNDLYQCLLDGIVDAVIMDHPINLYYQKKYHGKLVCVGDLLTQEFFGIAVAKGNNALRQKLNDGMQTIMDSGTYARIYNKYIKDFSEEKSLLQQEKLHKHELVAGYYPYPPYCIKNPGNGELSGFDIELLRAIAKDQKLKLTFQEVPFDNVIELLKKRKIDLLIGLSITPARERYIDFSWPFNLLAQQLMVTTESNIKSIYDLQGKNVGCVSGSGFDYCTKLKTNGMVKEITLFEQYDELFLALIAGKIDAIINELPVNFYYMDKFAGELKNVGNVLTREYAGFGFPKGADILKDCINRGINNVMASGKYSTIYKKYLSRSNMRMNMQIEDIKNIAEQKETIQPKRVE